MKHLAEMHGGTVEAQSAGAGQGSTFIVHLPIRAVRIDEIDVEDDPSAAAEDDSAGPAVTSGPPPVRLDRLRVLVVDDEDDARRMLTKVLEDVGARVTVAASAAEALVTLADAKAKSEGPDVLVSDVGMPDQDGYDLIREVRRRGHHAEVLPAVALTAYAHKDDAHEATMAGFQVHIPKPVNIGDLTAVIANLTGRTG